jgi:hypothetical protein
MRYEYNAETLAAIDNVDHNRDMSPAFESVKALMRSLKSGGGAAATKKA